MTHATEAACRDLLACLMCQKQRLAPGDVAGASSLEEQLRRVTTAIARFGVLAEMARAAQARESRLQQLAADDAECRAALATVHRLLAAREREHAALLARLTRMRSYADRARRNLADAQASLSGNLKAALRDAEAIGDEARARQLARDLAAVDRPCAPLAEDLAVATERAAALEVLTAQAASALVGEQSFVSAFEDQLAEGAAERSLIEYHERLAALAIATGAVLQHTAYAERIGFRVPELPVFVPAWVPCAESELTATKVLPTRVIRRRLALAHPDAADASGAELTTRWPEAQ